tara:strand:- start:496 stop:1467 length:972 start_codon:yes stop_codon:yes gene_type:complete
MECDKLLPSGKWTACEKLEKLNNMQNMHCTIKVTDAGKDCCVCSLHVKMYELYRWTERKVNGNIGLQHLIEIFYAILCYFILHEYKPMEADVDSDDEIEFGILSHYTRHIEFIKRNWYSLISDKTSLSHYLTKIIETASFKCSSIDQEKDLYIKYLENYLSARNLDIHLETYTQMHTAHYSQLFDEYFEGRHTGLVNSFGGYGPNEYTKHSFVTAHVKNETNSCVGFVCLQEFLKSDRNLSMQGIVSCPFYGSCQSNENGKLGAANSLILYLGRYRRGRNIEVDPISQNARWKNRLADFPFFVNSKNQPFEKVEERHKKQRKH